MAASGHPALELAAFALAEPTPDAEAFVVAQRVLQALGLDVAPAADPLGLARRTALLRKESLWIGLRAQSPLLPLGRVPEQVHPFNLRFHRRASFSALAAMPALTPHARGVFLAGMKRFAPRHSHNPTEITRV